MADDKIQQSVEEMIKYDMSAQGMILPRSKFMTPDMGDLDKDQTSLDFLNSIEESIGNKAGGFNAAFYVEEPYTTQLGYHEEANIFCISATPTFMKEGGELEVELNQHDGDTVYFSFDSLNDGGKAFSIAQKRYKNITEYLELNGSSREYSAGRFGVRFAGVNSPEIPHFATAPWSAILKEGTDDLNIENIEIGNLKNGNGQYIHYKHIGDSDNIKVKCYKNPTDGKYYEVLCDDSGNPKKFYVKVSSWDNESSKEVKKDVPVFAFVTEDATETANIRYYQEGIKAKEAVINTLKKAEDLIIILDAKTVSKISAEWENIYEEDILTYTWKLIKGIWDQSFQFQFSYLGFNNFGQEVHKRFLGCVYAKIPVNGTSTWINLSKLMLSSSDQAEALKDYSNDPLNAQNYSFLSDAFKLWSYNQLKEGKFIDSLYEMSKKDLDDRIKIQKEIMGRDWTEMKDWTVMIGDCLFMVPPTSIRTVSQTQNERMSVMRARGAMVKGAPKVLRQIEMTLYFNDHGINGVPYETNLPNGEKITYYMNGLRALIAQFKLTPFLPIENSYINELLGIEAVTLNNLQISTVDGYPRCLAATLVVEEFDYRIYMPEIPGPDPESDDLAKNLFASTIHYETMRWYYQQPIIRGELYADADPLNADYLQNTFGGKSVLQPMSFGDSSIKFFVPNKEFLDKQLQLKLNAISSPLQVLMPENEGVKQFKKDCAGSYDALIEMFNSEEFKAMIQKLQSKEIINGKEYLLMTDTYNNLVVHSDKMLNESSLIKSNSKKFSDRVTQEYISEQINPIFQYIQENINSAIPVALGYKVKEIKEVNKATGEAVLTWKFSIKVDTSGIGTLDDWKNFAHNNVEKKILGLKDEEFGTALTDDREIIINMTSKFKEKGVMISSFALDTSSPGMRFLQLCGSDPLDDSDFNSAADDAANMDQNVLKNQQDYMTSEKEKIDLYTAQSIKFDEYPIGNVIVKTVACVLGNTMSRTTLQSSDAYAPQYMGGQDTVIEVMLETTDEIAVIQLQQLPKFAAMYARDYRLILNAWPLRIDTEITRMLSVNEVIIESVDVSTVPAQPGLYRISLRLMSLDRSLKNRESLNKLDTANNNGTIAESATNSTQAKNYFDLKKSLSRVEVYPDLELPTIDQLASKGFKFIKYANATNIKNYPDPDFYFVYAHVLNSEVMQTSIKEFFKDNPNMATPTFTLEDMFGGMIDIAPTKDTAYAVTAVNSVAADVGKNATEFKKSIQELSKQYSNVENDSNFEKYEDIIKLTTRAEFSKSWPISNEILIHLRESKYMNLVSDSAPGSENNKYISAIKEASKRVIDIIDAELSTGMFTSSLAPKDWVKKWHGSYDEKAWTGKDPNHSTDGTSDEFIDHISNSIKDFVDDFFKSEGAPGRKVLEALMINPEGIGEITKALPGILIAAAASKSGRNTYTEKAKKQDWYPQMFSRTEDVSRWYDVLLNTLDLKTAGNQGLYFPKGSDGMPIPICDCALKPGLYENDRQAVSYTDALQNGIRFGMYKIEKFPSEDALSSILREKVSGGEELFLDPYYRTSASANERTFYKKTILTEAYYAAYAFTRNVLVMIKKLVSDGIMISFFDFIYNMAYKKVPIENSNDNMSTYAAAYEGTTDVANSFNSSSTYARGYSSQTIETVSNETKTPEQLAKEYAKAKEDTIKNLGKEVSKLLKDNNGKYAIGKFVLPTIVTILNNDEFLYQVLRNGDYDALEGMISATVDGSYSPFQIANGNNLFMKFIHGMVGAKVIKRESSLGGKDSGKKGDSNKEADDYVRTVSNEVVYLDEADDPRYYILHSFYDMVMNDKRGRMARAFPTFYMMFIDEGREIALWKLHDNFYTMSSISEIEVVKSRKIAADTAHITMSNMFKTFVSDDDDQRIGYNDYTWKDVYTSIFSPRIYYIKEEARRKAANPAARAVIKPGIRIHLRAGYGSDASQLPILFNGVMTEVENGDVIDIIAQGDGVELTNPLVSDLDAEDVAFQDEFIVSKWFRSLIQHGASPRTILGSLLTTRGGYIKKTIYNLTNGRFFNSNPYGIVHFGEPEFKTIFSDGEPLQNIYEGTARPSWGGEKDDIYTIAQKNQDLLNKAYAEYAEEYNSYITDPKYTPASNISEKLNMEGPPLLSTQIFGKSYWDIMHICRSACPDFVCSVVPFGLRSSIFFGAPRFYYAYEYERMPDGSIIEKRKPFQQYHIYTSYSDIIGNGIIASERDVRTCAVGTYTQNGWLAKSGYKRTEPLWVSIDIYPEKQKTMTVDTQLTAKGSAAGDIIPFMNWINNEFGDESGKSTKDISGGHALAWRMTASALKDSVKDMYKGQLIILGDPTVKPYDRVTISDIYERMQGSFEVEAVTHSLSVDGGFTTTINPDCIACIDDRFEQITQHWYNSVASKAIATQTILVATSAAFGRKQRPLLQSLAKYFQGSKNGDPNLIEKIGSLFGKDDIMSNEEWVNKITEVNDFFKVDSKALRLENYVNAIKNIDDVFKLDIESIESIDDLIESVNKMNSAVKRTDPETILKSLKAVDTKNFKAKDLEVFNDMKAALEDAVKSNTGFTKAMTEAYLKSGEMEDTYKLLTEAKKLAKFKDSTEIDDAIKIAEQLAKTGSKSVDDMAKYSKVLSQIGKISPDDLKDIKNGTQMLDDIIKNGRHIQRIADVGVKSADDIIRVAGGLSTLDSAAGLSLMSTTVMGGILTSAIFLAAEMAITWAITSFVNEFIERWMKSLQVVQVFPLSHDGKPMTAGLDGAKGAVVGSPGYTDPGLIGGYLQKLLPEGKKETLGWDIIRNMFLTNEMTSAIKKLKHSNGFTGASMDASVVERTGIINELLQSLTSDEVKMANNFRGMMIQPRVKSLADKQSIDTKLAYNKYKIMDVKGFTNNPEILENMICIETGQVIKNMLSLGYMDILHESNLELPSKVVRRPAEMSIQGNKMNIEILVDTRAGNEIADIPFLRADAYYLLLEIIDRLDKKYNKQGNKYGEGNWFEEHKVVLTSALRIGEKTWSSTGFKFSMYVTNYDGLETEIKEVIQDCQKVLNTLNRAEYAFFTYENVGGNNFSFMVYPPKVNNA